MTDNAFREVLPSGVPGLDAVMGGGLPRLSFNIIGGAPGSGKTTCAQQLMFSLATPSHRALYFTAFGEPPVKMLRYQQRFKFFDLGKLDGAIKFINLGADVVAGDFQKVLARIADEVRLFEPALVFIDSFISITKRTIEAPGGMSLVEAFGQQLAMMLTTWHATTVLIAEYGAEEIHSNPIFTIADGILWFSQSTYRSSVIRKVQIMKMRGQRQIPGLHTLAIDNSGLRIFPRVLAQLPTQPMPSDMLPVRLSMGVPALDDMMGGGLPAGYSLLLVGPSGCGKTRIATEFIIAGARRGESVVIATFEKRLLQTPNVQLRQLIRQNRIHVLAMHALDLSTDAVLFELGELLEKSAATRLVFDSLSAFELALAPEFRDDFRESMYRLISAITDRGVTVVMTTELENRVDELHVSPYGNAFLVDAIVMQRYVELHSRLCTAITVVKLRGSAHSRDLRPFCITDSGIEIGLDPLGYDRMLDAHPAKASST